MAESLGLPEKFHPGKYPKRKFGKQGKEERFFRADWCQKYPWIHYDAAKDAAFCYVCMSAAHEGKFLVSTKRDPAFLTILEVLPTGKRLQWPLTSTSQVIATWKLQKQ